MEPPTSYKILILDFGSQYSHLIVRRCRECGVYSELLPCNISVEAIMAFKPTGIIMSGGPCSVFDLESPHVADGIWNLIKTNGIPLLGICYGLQEMQHHLGGTVSASMHREFGRAVLEIPESANDPLLSGVPLKSDVWMSHSDRVVKLAAGFKSIASSCNSEFAAVSDTSRKIWGVQFHPEVTHTEHGKTILANFIHKICKVPQDSWNMNVFAHLEIERLRKTVGNRKVIGALSGGVDSTVAAALLYQAIGCQFHGFLVDNGLLRKGEGSVVLGRLKKLFPGLQVELIDASEEFLAALKDVTDPEQKRKIIGYQFVEAFKTAVAKLTQTASPGAYDDAFLLQGTLYPDIIESVSFKGPSHTIKSHHNVGGLPEAMPFELLEPLRELFKDEVRALGMELGLEHDAVWRHPFPGPGLAIRIIGSVDRERVGILREADAIFIEELRASKDYGKIGQAFAVLVPECRSVGVMGDQRTYGMTAVLRAIETSDFMTGDWYNMPYDVLKRCSSRIINEVHEINRVCYDISSKPPATIEWE